jgi:hypothetical protein
LPEFLSFISDYLRLFGIQYQQDYNTLVYGMILLLIMLFLPEGIFSGLRGLLAKVLAFFQKSGQTSLERESAGPSSRPSSAGKPLGGLSGHDQ